jgi:aspartyl-tRNA(Asn)/glutamyl-tRNA(Gln) amidotransferase subunit A
MSGESLRRATAAELRGAFQSGAATSRAVTDELFAAIEGEDGVLGAWLHLRHEEARAEADRADARYATARAAGAAALNELPPLLGVPVALKDLVNLTGTPTTAGSRILEGYVSPYDATIAARLKDAGAVILGKTNMDEFAMGSSTEFSAYKKTVNPWATDRVPGGSSGGSSAAVAAFHAPLSIGTDTGGSIRQPASLTGRHEADLRSRLALRHRRLRIVAGSGRTICAHGARCSTPAPCHCGR